MKIKQFQICVNVFIISLSLSVTFGWLLHIEILKSIIPGYTSMKFNTAISFIVSAIIFYFTLEKRYIKFAHALSITLVVLSLLVLSQYVFNYNLGIDQLFVSDNNSILLDRPHPGRMAQSTLVCFTLLGLSFIFINSNQKKLQPFAQFFLIVIGLIAFIAIEGYLFKIPAFYTFSVLASMPLHTALSFFSLTIAVALMNPSLGLVGLFTSDRMGSIMARKLFPQMFLLIIMLAFGRLELNKYNLVSVEFGIVLFATTFMLVGLFLIWNTALVINKIDANRYEAKQEITELNKNLEIKVIQRTEELTFTIEELKATEDQLDQYKRFFYLSNDLLCIADKKGNFKVINPAFSALLGYSTDEIMVRHFTSFIHPDDLASSLEELKKIEQLNPSIRLVNRYRCKDGSYVHLQWVSSADPSTNQIFAIAHNITELKTLQDDLATLNNEMNSILDSAYVSIINASPDGTIKHFSKGAELLLGYSKEEMIGIHTPAIIHLEEEMVTRAKEMSEKYNEEISGFDVFTYFSKRGLPDTRQWTYVRKDKTTFPVQLVITSIVGSNGIMTGNLGIASDITDLNKAKDDLNSLAIHLQKKNNQLLSFAHITSHNLRSPVVNLNSLLEFYKIAPDEEEKEMLLDKLETVVHHLNTTLNDLIDSLKVQEDITKEREILYFNDTFNKTKEILSGTIMDCKAQITCDFSKASHVNYPKTYLESIFLNLFSNAMKYQSPDRTPVIHFETNTINGEISLSVTDNGLGIDMKKYGNKLFGMNKTFHRHAEAKGVGLYMTKIQVEAMGGTIAAESEVNRGTTFTVIFNSNLT